jgi:hypothetical protein
MKRNVRSKKDQAMLHLKACQKKLRPHLPLKLFTIMLCVCLGLIVYAKSSRTATDPFALASDLPRGPLVYAQFKDLPALVKQWDDSALKEQYLGSTNFQQLGKSHLWLKLSERWDEFNNALGFMLDAEALTGTAENSAAVAVYDIGRLDLVLIAPLGEEKLAATKFFENQEKFEETELPDGTVYYRLDVEADRGRQKQQIVFASLRGRFVLATSERLLLRTLANINGKAQRDRLSDDPAFKSLSKQVQPHFVSVWVDQSKLNGDWYFKHYWLMQNIEHLKNIRACLFDLEQQDGRWIERRDLLYTGGKRPQRSGIPGPEARRLSAMIPGGVPYFKLQALNGDSQANAAALIRDALLDRLSRDKTASQKSWDWQSYSNSDFEIARDDESSAESDYSYLDDDYDSTIDDAGDAGIMGREEPGDSPLRDEAEGSFTASLKGTLAPAHPLWAATLTSPQMMKGPLFVEFRRAAVLTLRSPGGLNQGALESAVGEAVQARLMTAGSSANLKWTSADGQGEYWRQLEVPMLGWELCYAVKGQELIVSNSLELLRSILVGERRKGPLADVATDSATQIDDLTVIDLDQRKQAFDDVFDRLDAQDVKDYWKRRGESAEGVPAGTSQEFFSGNVSSLLGAVSRVGQIEIKRNSLPDRLHEEIDFVLK